MYAILVIVGLVAGLLSGSVGFGGAMLVIPVITYMFGVEQAASTIAQLMSNLSRTVIGWRSIDWKAVGYFLMLAAPLTALGAFGFATVPAKPMTVALCVFLIVFAIWKLVGNRELPHRKGTMIIGGGVTGLINGLLGISGPLSSAVFLSWSLAPVAYIASEATAAAAMHVIKAVVYNKLSLIDLDILTKGLTVGISMTVGNFVAMRLIGKIRNKAYKRLVASVMILACIALIITTLR
jgi:uncharacterized membrane protein YfcA